MKVVPETSAPPAMSSSSNTGTGGGLNAVMGNSVTNVRPATGGPGRFGPGLSRNKYDTMPVDSNDFISREYQNELFEKAKERNTVVCLGTGTGKTYIAVMLIKHYSHQVRGDFDGDAKRTIFLVPEVCLVSQQSKVIRQHTDLTVGEYIGEMNLDTWDKTLWHEQFAKNQVLVMTAEIFRVIISQGFVPLSKINLLIFDEAHHAQKNHPYNEVMKCFDTCTDPPKILGLSASLINSKAKPHQIKSMIESLGRNLRSTCETASDMKIVNKYGAKPKEVIYSINNVDTIPNEISAVVSNIVSQLFDFANGFIKKINLQEQDQRACLRLKKCLTNVADILDRKIGLGVWCARELANLYSKELGEYCAMAMHNDAARKVCSLYSVGLTLMNYTVVRLDSVLKNYDMETRCTKFASPKMKELLKVLQNHKSSTEGGDESVPIVDHGKHSHRSSLCGIVFVERRAFVKLLTLWLQKLAECNEEKYGFLKVEGCVGQSSSGAASPMVITSSKQQDIILSKFRRHEYNVLVATSVLEEGLDVPRCNLVVRFDFPKTVREYIQSKGRARDVNGKYIFLIESYFEGKMIQDLKQFREVEEILNNVSSLELDADNEGIDNSDDLLPPYMPSRVDGAARVTLNSAISIVNRYCLKLPSDSFTRLAPLCKIRNIGTYGYVCEIRLPINSTIRGSIEGLPMSNSRLAKKAAALKACEELHKAGELDDNFLPAGKEVTKYFEELEFEICEEESELEKNVKGQPRAGTTKRRQYYNKNIANVLKGAPPQSGAQCYLYVFAMELVCPIPEEQNVRGRKICDPGTSTRCMGILSTRKLPLICDFPVFTRSGEVNVTLVEAKAGLTLSSDQLEKVIKFHKFTFNDVLRLEKYPMKFDYTKSECAYYVVPANWSSSDDVNVPSAPQVDWTFLDRVFKYEERFGPELNENGQFVFQRELFEDAVIKPWYRQNKTQHFFYVAEILDNLTPSSPFPSSNFDTFSKYYRDKYDLNITNNDQPLLDVDHTSARLNLLTPRYVNRKGMTLPLSTARTKKEKRENMQEKQILVPELCIVHPFSAAFWRKAVCLPCMLYRLNQFLLAEQLRQQIVMTTRVGKLDLPTGFHWPALDFGWTLADALIQQEALEALEKEQSNNSSSATAQKVPTEKNPAAAVAPPPSKAPTSPVPECDFVIDTFDANFYAAPAEHLVDELSEGILTGGWSMDLNGLAGGGVFEITTPGDTQPIGTWDLPASSIPLEGNWTPTKATAGKLKPVNGVSIKEVDDDGNLVMDDSDEESDLDSNEDFRVGSPSNFESKFGDAPWDQTEEGAQFVSTNILGLEKISATGDINIQGLCEDLSKTNFDDEYGSEDEICDDDDDEMFSSDYVRKKPSTEKDSAAQPAFTQNVITAGLNETLLDGLLSTPTPPPELENDEITQLCRDADPSPEKQSDEPMEESEMSQTERLKRAVESALPIFHNLQLDTPKKQKLSVEKTSLLVEPAFGELLSVRDDSVDAVDQISIKFDAYKSDNDNCFGPSPSVILQALTMSNASDGINLERLETVGDSFLKYAVTAFLFTMCPNIHEGKLSWLRSRQISNKHLYCLGKRIGLGEFMTAIKFEPSDNWLPPCYSVPDGLDKALIKIGMPATGCDLSELRAFDPDLSSKTEDVIMNVVQTKSQSILNPGAVAKLETFKDVDNEDQKKIPYNLLTQQSIPDKSIADCVEALIGAYLLHAGQRGALLFMKSIGLKVMPKEEDPSLNSDPQDPIWHWLPRVKSPLLPLLDGEGYEVRRQLQQTRLNELYKGHGLDKFETEVLHYSFIDKAYLVQAFTHNSFYDNNVTDCYQRLEFLGDAVLDFLITRHLFEDKQKHSPGALTDLRSALVNNTFFASLAVKYRFNKYMKLLSHDLFKVINSYVEKFCSPERESDYNLFVGEEEVENLEDIEVPKALGDIFESVAGAIYLDSGMSLDTVWRVFYRMMRPEIEYFSKNVPKSPIRELLEMQPQNVQFGRPEVIKGKKVRVVVDVFGETGKFVGIGRNKRIAKCTAAKRALRELKGKNKN